jgi:hypothetical protein
MELDRDAVFSAVYTGNLVDCTEEQFPQVDTWLAQCAAFHADNGDGLRAFIALNERKRLREKFEVSTREA